MIETGTHRVEPLRFVACMLVHVKDVSAQAEDGHPTDKRRTRAVVWSDQQIRAENVPIEARAALKAGNRNPKVMQSGQARTAAITFHEPDRAIGTGEAASGALPENGRGSSPVPAAE
jgi:hypothetical protein